MNKLLIQALGIPCTVLYCIVLYCTVLYCIVLYCTVLYFMCNGIIDVVFVYISVGSKRDIHGILQVNEELESAGIKPHISFYKLKDELIGQYEKERKMEEALRLLK